jgi:hypothetical protein
MPSTASFRAKVELLMSYHWPETSASSSTVSRGAVCTGRIIHDTDIEFLHANAQCYSAGDRMPSLQGRRTHIIRVLEAVRWNKKASRVLDISPAPLPEDRGAQLEPEPRPRGRQTGDGGRP